MFSGDKLKFKQADCVQKSGKIYQVCARQTKGPYPLHMNPVSIQSKKSDLIHAGFDAPLGGEVGLDGVSQGSCCCVVRLFEAAPVAHVPV